MSVIASETSRVSKKGLTTIPSTIRKAARIKEGDIIVWEVRETREIVIKVEKDPYEKLRGKYSSPELTYKKLEEKADLLLEAEVHANNRARHDDSSS